MATNPNNAVGTNGAYGGRTSVNAFNDILSAYTAGIVSGWECAPDSGLTVSLGGNGTTRDVAIAENNDGNKTTINNISGSPINVTLDAAPGSNSRIDLVVAYVDNPPQGQSTEVDNPGACGIINVTGTAGVSPSAPDDTAIRTAITADGASGVTAYYVILASITVANGTTDLTAGDITAGGQSKLSGSEMVTSNNIDYTTMKKWVPDYTNMDANSMLTGSGKTHTITISTTGFITYAIKRYGAGNKSRLYINDRIVIEEEAVNNNAYGPNGVIPVSAGDEIYCVYNTDTSGNGIWFIPGKWVD